MDIEDRNRVKVDLVDHEEGFRFEIRRLGSQYTGPLEVDDFTAEAFKEYGDIFTEGLSLHNALNEQSITAAITNVSDLLNMTLENYESDCTSFKCILASSISNANGIGFITTGQRVSKDIFAENYAILAVKVFEAMRKTKAGNAGGSNIYRLVHCIVHQGNHTNLLQPYAYAIFTIFLQACMFSYVCAHSVYNLPRHEESMANMPLAILVFVYQLLLLLPEVRDTLAVGRSGFWDSDKRSLLRFFDVLSNIIMPIILLPIGTMLVLTAENMLEAVLSSTAVLFIPTLDNDIINLMGKNDVDVVKKHIAQESLHQIADHFFRFQIEFEDHDPFGDLEQSYGSISSDTYSRYPDGTTNPYQLQISIPPSNTINSRLLMNHRSGHTHSGLTFCTNSMTESPITEPMLSDMVITGADALLKCVVFDAFCTTRSLDHLNHRAVSVKNGRWTPKSGLAEGFSELPRDSYHEVFFSEARLVSTSSLFTHMEYKIDTVAPYSIVYMKLWRLGGDASRDTVEYRTKSYSDKYPTQTLEPGCFIITNLVITDCIDTLRICWSPTAQLLLNALSYYTLFDCDDAAIGALKRDTNTAETDKRTRAGTPTRRTSILTQQMKKVYRYDM
eukprot:gene7853-9364_t